MSIRALGTGVDIVGEANGYTSGKRDAIGLFIGGCGPIQKYFSDRRPEPGDAVLEFP